MVRQGYLPWLKRGERVTAHVHESGYFAEHSTPKRYLQSNIDLLRSPALLSNPPPVASGIAASAKIPSSTEISPPVLIGENVTIGDGCRVGPDVVIGDGASLAPGMQISRSVVWAGGRAEGIVENAILTPNATIPADGADDVDG